MKSKVFVTGGAGFIGSNLVRHLISGLKQNTLVIDKLTYAGNMENLRGLINNKNFIFQNIDINETKKIYDLLIRYKPETIFHLAAETHVDKSIENPNSFIQTNVVGTQSILNACLQYYNELSREVKERFRVILVSTDEVFGSINAPKKFNEHSNIKPNSPYSASKASSDLLGLAFYKTYGLPVIVTNCSNNYGPYQLPEKLIPLCINKATNSNFIPIYGNGQQVRDWLHVHDHNKALLQIALTGSIGERYCIGGNCERTNLEVVTSICKVLDKLTNRDPNNSYSKLITHVPDRPGHDERYAINSEKVEDLGWKPQINFEQGIEQTVMWYLSNTVWLKSVIDRNHDILRRQGKL
jgi:dTDP-glucose 4,6-dehydratase